ASWDVDYAPGPCDDWLAPSNKVFGREREWQKLSKWFAEGHKQPLVIEGPAGTGKTSLVHRFAVLVDHQLVEVNASDTRTYDSAMNVLQRAATRNLVRRPALVLF